MILLKKEEVIEKLGTDDYILFHRPDVGEHSFNGEMEYRGRELNDVRQFVHISVMRELIRDETIIRYGTYYYRLATKNIGG